MLNDQFYGDIYASLNEILINSHTIIICHGDNNELLIYWRCQAFMWLWFFYWILIILSLLTKNSSSCSSFMAHWNHFIKWLAAVILLACSISQNWIIVDWGNSHADSSHWTLSINFYKMSLPSRWVIFVNIEKGTFN